MAAGASRAEEGPGSKRSSEARDGKSALTAQEDSDDAITDQIPQRPMGVVEGTSYTVIIIAAIAMAGNGSFSSSYSFRSCPQYGRPMHVQNAYLYLQIA